MDIPCEKCGHNGICVMSDDLRHYISNVDNVKASRVEFNITITCGRQIPYCRVKREFSFDKETGEMHPIGLDKPMYPNEACTYTNR